MSIAFTPLPSLKSKLKRDIPGHVVQKLNYQWKILHKSSVNSPQFKLGVSQSFMKTIDEFSVDLPVDVSQQFCPFCSSFLTAPMAASIRICPVRKNSKLNRKRTPGSRSKNDLVITCLLCERVAYRFPAFARTETSAVKTGISSADGADDAVANSSDTATTPSQKKNKRFSFLDKLDSDSERRGGTIDQHSSKKRLFGDVIRPQSSVKNTVLPAQKGSSTGTLAGSKVDLDALERKNKKQKKKQNTAGITLGRPNPSTSAAKGVPPAPSLNSLQSMFSIGKLN